MAAGRKEYELQMKLTAALGSNFNSSFQGAMSTVKKLQGTLQNVRKVQGDISAYKKTQEAINATKGKIQDYETKHNALQNELAQTIAKEKELQAALKKTEKTTGDESEEYKNLQNQLQATRNEKSKLKSQIKDNEHATDAANVKINEQRQKLSELSNELQAACVNTNLLTQENERLEKTYNRVKKAQEDYARVNSAIEQNKAAISATKTELLKTSGVITATGAAFYKGFVQPAAGLQEQMSSVRALISASSTDIEGDMAKLQAAAQKMGATTKFTAIEAGKALEYMGMAGWNAAQMEAGLPGIMNLAAASGEDLGAVSDIVTDALTAFGMKAEEAGHFADVLAQASSNANTDVGMMGATFQKVAPVAGALGYSVEDMSLGISLMANASIKAEVAGTSFKTALANMAKPTNQMKAYMDKYNISLTKSDGTMKTFGEVIENLRGSLGGLSKDEQVAAATAIFGKESFAGMLAIVNASESDFEKVSNAVNNASGAAERMANIKLDNLNGDITLAKSAWDGFATSIGNLFLPNMRTAAQSVTNFLNKANEFVQKNPEAVKQIAKVAAGLAALKVGSLAGNLGFLEMKGGVLEVVKAFTGFRAKIAENAAAAATGGGKFATLGKQITGYFSGVKSSVGGVRTAIGKLAAGPEIKGFGKIGNALSDSVLKPIGGLGGKIKGKFAKIGGSISGAVGSVFDKIAAGPIGKIGGVFGSLGKSIGTVLGGPLKAVSGLFGGLFGKAMPLIAIISALSMVFLQLSGEDISSFIEPLKAAFEQLKPVLAESMAQFQQLGKDLLPYITNAAKDLAPLLGQIVTAILPVIITLIQSLLPIVGELVKNLLPPILDIITAILPILTNIITSVLPVITTLLQTLLPVIMQLVSDVLPILVSVISTLLPPIKDLINAVLPILMSVLQALMPVIQVLADLFSGVLGTAIEAIKPIIEALTGVLKGIIDFVTGVFTGDWGKAWEGVKGIFESIINGLVAIFKIPINGLIDLINLFLEGLNSLTIPDWVPGVGGKGINIPLIPKLEKGSDFTPDTFIAGDVNGKGGELVTGARGRKVFTAAETSEIFKNISAAKSISENAPRKSIVDKVGGAFSAVKTAIAERIQGNTPRIAQTPTTNGGEIKFEIHYNPTIYVEGDKPGDLEEKLKQNNEKLLQTFKEFLQQKEEKERRTTYA